MPWGPLLKVEVDELSAAVDTVMPELVTTGFGEVGDVGVLLMLFVFLQETVKMLKVAMMPANNIL